jgi:ribokinase
MIHVVGNATIDSLIRLERFPMPGETVVAEGAAEDLGGKGANQATVIARCGVAVRLVAAIGDDETGRRIRDNLRTENVLTDGLWVCPGPTDRCVIYVDRAGENIIVSLIDAARTFDPLATTCLEQWIGDGDYALLQGNLRPAVSRDCLRLAKARGAVTVLNPSPTYRATDYDWSHVDLAIVNRGEAMEIGGHHDPIRAAHGLLQAGAGTIVLTEGAKGATWIGRDEHWRVDAPRVEAVDTVGAGDVFCGVLVAALATGGAPNDAVRAACEAAAVSVTRRGVFASFPSRAEIRQALAGIGGPRRLFEKATP